MIAWGFRRSEPNLAIPRPDLFPNLEDTSIQLSLSQSGAQGTCEKDQPFPTMSPIDLHELLSQPMSHSYSVILILDGRFWYGYQGGHLPNAKNVTTRAEMVEIFETYRDIGDVCVIIHCEFSQHRGPRLIWAWRDYDRTVHQDCYPVLSYPNLFLLKGGFNRYHREFPDECPTYVPMRHPDYLSNGELRRCKELHDREWRKDPRRRLMLPRARSQGDGFSMIPQFACDTGTRPVTPDPFLVPGPE
jgi:M-phase inducer tyrosine phosphatase